MRYLYLDESGDLGHDLTKGGTSRYFVITILEITDAKANKAIEKAIERTIRNKVRKKRPRQRNFFTELKASKMGFAIKEYFYRQVQNIPFNIYTLILDKKRFSNPLQLNHHRLYRLLTHLILKEMPLEQAEMHVILTLDKSMTKPQIRDFNKSLRYQLESRLPFQVPLSIYHDYSHENKSIQAVDLFAWGMYRKYELGEMNWYDVFKERVVYEQLYPPIK